MSGNSLGYKPYHLLSIKDDLLYSAYRKSNWNLSPDLSKSDQTKTTNIILADILTQDVEKDPPDAEPSPEEFRGLRKCLDTLQLRQKYTEQIFLDMLQNGRNVESGKNIGKFIRVSLEKLIPSDLVGGRLNKKSILRSFRKIFLFGRNDKIPLKFLCNGLKIKKITWLNHIKHVSYCLKTNILAKLIKWLWLITKKLVACYYYVSEAQGGNNVLVYIPKRVWKSQTDRAFNKLAKSSLLALNATQKEKQLSLRRPARLRWLPKGQAVRPIISVKNLAKEVDTLNAKAFLKSLHGKPTVNVKTIHKLWTKIIERHCVKDSSKKLYFVNMDVADAYGSINQAKLIHILHEEVVAQLGNRSFVTIDQISVNGKPRLICRELYKGTPNGIFSSLRVPVSQILNTIEAGISHQTIELSKTLYLIRKGIAQGVPLSAPLCELYLDHLDKTNLMEFFTNPDDTLIRAADDYLYVTPDKDRATKFYNIMEHGFDEYGIFVNKNKSQTNLNCEQEIAYFGFSINTANLEVYIKHSYGINVPFINMMTFNKWEEDSNKRFSILNERMKRLIPQKLVLLTVDRAYTTPRGLARNVFETACLMACCFITSVKTIYTFISVEQLLDIICDSARRVAARVSRLRGPSNSRQALTSDVRKSRPGGLLKAEIYWIVLKGFNLCVQHKDCKDGKYFPECIRQPLDNLELKSKVNVRPDTITLIEDILGMLPTQYKTGY